jgi:dTDP-4-dehydrorhamnose 3,5-epimerase
MLKVTPTAIADVLVIEPQMHGDKRGFFVETFHQREFDAAVGSHVEFVQDNHSRSGKGVLRGLHYQLPPHAQGKLVRVAQGAVFDVAVDLRRSSATFGRWVGTELSAENHRQLWIPEGFAHGFVVAGDSADVLYKTTQFYAAQAERTLRFDDPFLAIAWPSSNRAPRVSAKDAAGLPWSVLEHFDQPR